MFSTNVRTFHKWQHDTNHNFIDKILSVWYKETVAPPPFSRHYKKLYELKKYN